MKYLYLLVLLSISHTAFPQLQTFRDGPSIAFPSIQYVKDIKVNEHVRCGYLKVRDWNFLKSLMAKFETFQNFESRANLAYSKDKVGRRTLFIVPPETGIPVNYFYAFIIEKDGGMELDVYYNVRYWYIASDTLKNNVLENHILGNPNMIEDTYVMSNIRSWVSF